MSHCYLCFFISVSIRIIIFILIIFNSIKDWHEQKLKFLINLFCLLEINIKITQLIKLCMSLLTKKKINKYSNLVRKSMDIFEFFYFIQQMIITMYLLIRLYIYIYI